MAEIWEVRSRYRLLNSTPEECAENTHTLLFPAGLTSVIDLQHAFAQAWSPIVHLMHIDVMWEGIIVRRMAPHGSEAFALRFEEPIPGQVGGLVLPTSTAVEVLRDTSGYARGSRGKYWLPWLTNTMMDLVPHNRIHEDAAAAILGALDEFTFILSGHNVGGILATPVVYSRRAAGAGPTARVVTGYRVVYPLRTLAKRSRRTEPCPPFPDDRPHAGAMGFDTALWPFTGSSSGAHSHSLWKYKSLSLGNGLGNAPEPDGWMMPGYDASAWSDRHAIASIGPPTIPAGDFTTTPCVPGPSHRYSINYPDWFTNANDIGFLWRPDNATFGTEHWVTPTGGTTHPNTYPRDGHVIARTEFSAGAYRQILTCALDFFAMDSVCIWIDGELVIDQADGEWFYPVFPEPQSIGIALDPDIETHTIAIRLRSHHTPPGSVDPCTDPNQDHSWRVWHIYGDCGCYDALCLPTIFCFWYDQFQRAYAFLAFRLRAEWFDLPIPPDVAARPQLGEALV